MYLINGCLGFATVQSANISIVIFWLRSTSPATNVQNANLFFGQLTFCQKKNTESMTQQPLSHSNHIQYYQTAKFIFSVENNSFPF